MCKGKFQPRHTGECAHRKTYGEFWMACERHGFGIWYTRCGCVNQWVLVQFLMKHSHGYSCACIAAEHLGPALEMDYKGGNASGL